MVERGRDERIAVARRLFDSFNRASVEEAREACAPEVELLTLFGRVRGAQRDGHEGLREWLEHVSTAWAFFEAKVHRYETRGEWVIADGRSRGRGKGSSSEVEFEWTAVTRVVDGKIVRLGVYLTRDEALRALAEG